MADPVYSYRYGKRPLIDVPALQVSPGAYQSISSLQKPIPMYNPLPPPPHTATIMPIDPPVYHRPYHTAPPPDPFHYHHYDPNEKSRHIFYGPNGEVVKPLQHYFDQPSYPGVVYTTPPPPPPPPPPITHPLPPPNPHYQFHPPPRYGSRQTQEFDVNCDLEFGRIVRISVRESRGHFRGIPDYLRQELLKSYGKYPNMEVKIKFHHGEFHIFSNYDENRRRRKQQEVPRRVYNYNDYQEEDEDYDTGNDPELSSEAETDAIRPRPMAAPRGILRDKGWNSIN